MKLLSVLSVVSLLWGNVSGKMLATMAAGSSDGGPSAKEVAVALAKCGRHPYSVGGAVAAVGRAAGVVAVGGGCTLALCALTAPPHGPAALVAGFITPMGVGAVFEDYFKYDKLRYEADCRNALTRLQREVAERREREEREGTEAAHRFLRRGLRQDLAEDIMCFATPTHIAQEQCERLAQEEREAARRREQEEREAAERRAQEEREAAERREREERERRAQEEREAAEAEHIAYFYGV